MCSRSRIREAAVRRGALVAALALGVAACDRHAATSVEQAPPDRPSTQGTAVSTLFPGGGAPPAADPTGATYDGEPQAIAEGKRLFDWYNCSGCHFHGAGGMGPSLIDSQWIYGDHIDQIYASIYQGRPNGMPAWGAKLSSTEIWELAAYIRAAGREAAGQPLPTTPPPPVPDGAAHTIDAPSPAIVDLPAEQGGTPEKKP
ncbi:MAG TPA: cytochrome c [Dokdonella sp.]